MTAVGENVRDTYEKLLARFKRYEPMAALCACSAAYQGMPGPEDAPPKP